VFCPRSPVRQEQQTPASKECGAAASTIPRRTVARLRPSTYRSNTVFNERIHVLPILDAGEPAYHQLRRMKPILSHSWDEKTLTYCRLPLPQRLQIRCASGYPGAAAILRAFGDGGSTCPASPSATPRPRWAARCRDPAGSRAELNHGLFGLPQPESGSQGCNAPPPSPDRIGRRAPNADGGSRRSDWPDDSEGLYAVQSRIGPQGFFHLGRASATALLRKDGPDCCGLA